MTTFLLPLRNDLNNYDYRVDLAGDTYRLKFTYNIREERYHLSIYSDVGVLLATTPLVLNNDLIGRFRPSQPNLPAGTLYTIRESGSNEEPEKEDYGVDFQLYFTDVVL